MMGTCWLCYTVQLNHLIRFEILMRGSIKFWRKLVCLHLLHITPTQYSFNRCINYITHLWLICLAGTSNFHNTMFNVSLCTWVISRVTVCDSLYPQISCIMQESIERVSTWNMTCSKPVIDWLSFIWYLVKPILEQLYHTSA